MITFEHIRIPDGEYDWVLKGSLNNSDRVTVTNNVILWNGTSYAITADGCATFHGDIFFPVAKNLQTTETEDAFLKDKWGM